MRLLSKSDIVKHKSLEQKRAIDQGRKLAESVDRLREIKSEEERSLEKYRSRMIENISKETIAATTERDGLLEKISTLKAEHISLQKVLEEEVQQKKFTLTLLENLVIKVKKLERGALENEAITNTERKLAVLEKKKSAQIHSDAEALFLDAANEKNNAQLLLEQASKIKREVLKEKEDGNADLFKQSVALSIREKNAALKEKSVNDRENELMVSWKLLNDRKTMFERTMNRIKK